MTLTKRVMILLPAAFLFAGGAMAQVPPASLTQLDGTAGPVYTVPPAPPIPAGAAGCSYGGVSAPCDYWNGINGTGAVGTSVFPFTATQPFNHYAVNTFVTGGQGGQSFQGGGSKDPNNTTQWKWSTTPTPDKDTLTNAYAAGYNAGGHTILQFGADRFSINGDANIGAWFFQQNVEPVSGGTFGPGSHVNGDIFLISAFTGGGGTATITVYLWDSGPTGLPGGPSGGCTASNYPTPSHLPACAATNLLEVYSSSNVCGSNPTCAITNSGQTTVTWNYQAKASGSTANIVPAGALFTGGVDLTYIFGLIGTNVPCISSFLMDTRSSQSPTAVLKDFIGGNFQLCAISASASCANSPTYDVSPPVIHYSVSGSVKNEASGNLYGLQVILPVSVPAGATNVVVTQPVTPSGGLPGGQSLPFGVTFDFPNEGALSVSGAVCGAAFSGGPCTVVNKPDGTPATWSASLGSGTCSITVDTSLSLTKSCVVNLSPGSGGVVLQLADTITVCNTDSKDSVLNISLSNAVSNVTGSPFSVAAGVTLTAGQCRTYSPTYTPTDCVGGVDPSGGGRCLFQDTVSISSIPTDEFGNALPSSSIPSAQTAMCHVCVFGECTSTGTP